MEDVNCRRSGTLSPHPPTKSRNGKYVVIKRRGSRNVAFIEGRDPVFLADADVPMFVQQAIINTEEKKTDETVIQRPQSSDSKVHCSRRVTFAGRRNVPRLDATDPSVPPELLPLIRTTQSANSSANPRILISSEASTHDTTKTARIAPKKVSLGSSGMQHWMDMEEEDGRSPPFGTDNIASEASRRAIEELQKKCEELEKKYINEVRRGCIREYSGQLLRHVLSHEMTRRVAEQHIRKKRADEERMALLQSTARMCLDDVLGRSTRMVLSHVLRREMAWSFVEDKIKKVAADVLPVLLAHSVTARKALGDDLVNTVLHKAVLRVSGADVVGELLPVLLGGAGEMCGDPDSTGANDQEMRNQYEAALLTLQQEFEESQRIIRELQMRRAMLLQQSAVGAHTISNEEYSDDDDDGDITPGECIGSGDEYTPRKESVMERPGASMPLPGEGMPVFILNYLQLQRVCDTLSQNWEGKYRRLAAESAVILKEKQQQGLVSIVRLWRGRIPIEIQLSKKWIWWQMRSFSTI